MSKLTAKSSRTTRSERTTTTRVKSKSSSEKSTKNKKGSPKSASKRASVAKSPAADLSEDCAHCKSSLQAKDKALFVEEEIGRVFCSEDCIASYFGPEVDRLEKEYMKRLSSSDLSGDEREKLAHLRWVTLEEPDEIWREKTLSGDFRYTLISEFKPGSKPIWCVCICLFLRGEPSFLYLAFPTKNAAMVNQYRRGERMQWQKKKNETQASASREIPETLQEASPSANPSASSNSGSGKDAKPEKTDGLADAWTEDETLRAELTGRRRSDDIPTSEYELYQACLEETLETPDEVWSVKPEALPSSEGDNPKVYHFIKRYKDELPAVWYIVVARETEDEEEIELLDSFPTRDADLVESYRRGFQEIGATEEASQSRLVH
jgi:hypothetical protein